MTRHTFTPNSLNDYCTQCDLPRYSSVHEDTVSVNSIVHIDARTDRADVARAMRDAGASVRAAIAAGVMGKFVIRSQVE